MLTDEIIGLRLNWDTVCRLACKAMCLGITWDQVCELAIKEYVGETDPEEEGA